MLVMINYCFNKITHKNVISNQWCYNLLKVLMCNIVDTKNNIKLFYITIIVLIRINPIFLILTLSP